MYVLIFKVRICIYKNIIVDFSILLVYNDKQKGEKYAENNNVVL